MEISNLEQTLRTQFCTRKVETQNEFDQFMVAINKSQSACNKPISDQIDKLQQEIDLLRLQSKSIYMQIDTLLMQVKKLHSERKQNNIIYHNIKHEMILLNPIGEPKNV